MAYAPGQEKASSRIEGLTMDFGEVFRILQRHWRVSLPILLLTVLATAGMYLAWPTKYQSTAQITLVGPESLATAQGNGNNPYLVVGNLEPMANILATNLSTEQAAQRLNALGVTGSFTAVVPPFAAGPFIALSLEGKDSAAISRDMPVVIGFTKQQLRAMQENGSVQTPSSGIVGASVIAQPSTPAPVLKTKIELVAGVFVLGMLALFLLSFGAEARAGRRRRKNRLYGGRRRENAAPRGVNQVPGVNEIGIGQSQRESQGPRQQDSQPVRVQ